MNEHRKTTQNLYTEELKMHKANAGFIHICTWNEGNEEYIPNVDGEILSNRTI
jgi:hypothetical protein